MGGLHRARLRSALYENKLFTTIDKSVLPDFEQALELIALQGGDTLMRQGEPSDALYVVINGRLRVVSTNSQGIETQINELGSGQIVGEMGLLTGEPRSATIYTIRNTLLGRLDAEAFYGLMQKHPQSMTRLFSSRIIADIRDKTQESQRKQTTSGTLALVAFGADVPLAEFATQLTQALSRYGSALHISDALTDHVLGQSGIAHAPWHRRPISGCCSGLASKKKNTII